MSFVGVIPARGGSKRLPRKNVLPFAGKPLLAWTAEAALASSLDAVILSTDDPETAEIGRACGLEVPFMRPAALADDAAPMLPVLSHLADWLEQNRTLPEALVLLQPTSPLRQARHIDEAVMLFRDSRADSLISVTEMPTACKPSKFMRQDPAGRLHEAGFADSGDLVLRNGPGIAITTPGTIRRGRLYGDSIVAYRMPRELSYDIDDRHDFEIAEFVMRRMLDRQRKKS